VTDAFPAGIENITWTCSAPSGSSCAASGTQNGNINTSISLAAASTATFTVNGTIKSSETNPMSNTAFVSSTIDPNAANNSATDITSLNPQADLQANIEVTASPVISNTDLAYTLTITNTGPSDATDVILTDSLPEEADFISSSPGGPQCTHADGELTCNYDRLTPGAKVNISLVVHTPSEKVTITNEMEVKANETDPNPANNTKTLDSNVN
jgi:uncharacterized repeat protein (TIGR01451 family)